MALVLFLNISFFVGSLLWTILSKQNQTLSCRNNRTLYKELKVQVSNCRPTFKSINYLERSKSTRCDQLELLSPVCVDDLISYCSWMVNTILDWGWDRARSPNVALTLEAIGASTTTYRIKVNGTKTRNLFHAAHLQYLTWRGWSKIRAVILYHTICACFTTVLCLRYHWDRLSSRRTSWRIKSNSLRHGSGEWCSCYV